MLSFFIDRIREVRKARYLNSLKSRGLKIGNNVYLNDGYFLDPSHCFLIAIEDEVVFGPCVRVLAHDASSKKLIGDTKIALVRISKGVFVGGFSVILPGVTIGAGSIIGSHSTVTRSVPPGEVWAGSPARKITDVEELKMRLLKQRKESFPYSEYAIERICNKKRVELIDYIQIEGTAFIE